MSFRRRPISPRTARGINLRKAFVPVQDRKVRLWWDPKTVSGTVASWVDRVAGIAATQAVAGAKPSATTTAFNSAYPGVVSDGNDGLAANVGSVLDGLGSITVVLAAVDTDAGESILLEYSADTTANAGSFYLAVEDAGAPANSVTVSTGGVAAGTLGRKYASEESLAAARVISFGIDFTAAGAAQVSWIRVNGVSRPLTTLTNTATAQTAGNYSLYFFSRAGTGATAPWTGALGNVIVREGCVQDGGLVALEHYVAREAGISLLDPAYAPRSDSKSILWLDPTSVSGSVASWTDEIASIAAAQANPLYRPTASATAISSMYPGVTNASAAYLTSTAIGDLLDGKESITITYAAVDNAVDTGVVVGLVRDNSYSNEIDGAFSVIVDGWRPNDVSMSVRGVNNYTNLYLEPALGEAISPGVISLGIDWSAAGAPAVAFIRTNGVTRSLATAISANEPGTALAGTFLLFAHEDGTFPWLGTFGNIVIRDGVDLDAGLVMVERFVGAEAGLVL